MLKLGSFYLNDCFSKKSLKENFFPNIIYPKSSTQSNHVFELIYEHNPLQNVKSKGLKHSGNLIVKSCGLDIIYNLVIFEQIKLFFRRSSKFYAKASKVLIKKNKKRTETEVKLNTSYHNSVIHKINFNFEITAPKVIFPQSFNTKKPLVVIFDFGRLALVNRSNNLNLSLVKPTNSSLSSFEKNQSSSGEKNFLKFKINENISDDEDDDIFVTPSSTPTNEKTYSSVDLQVSESSLENNLYSIYDLFLNDLQTVIGKFISTFAILTGVKKFYASTLNYFWKKSQLI